MGLQWSGSLSDGGGMAGRGSAGTSSGIRPGGGQAQAGEAGGIHYWAKLKLEKHSPHRPSTGPVWWKWFRAGCSGFRLVEVP